MLGLAGIRTTKKLTVSQPPTFTPRTGRKSTKTARQVFLEPGMWDRLSAVSDFTSAAWKRVNPKSLAISRNTVIEEFLEYALARYWEDKGGEPKTESERLRKIEPYAETLKKQGRKPDAESR